MVIGTPTVLNLIPGGVKKVIHVNQVNENIEIQFRIMNGTQPFNVPEGVSCTIRGTKGDNFGYAADVAVTAGSNVVTVTLTEQLTAVAGAGNVFELVFVGASDDMKVSTENFILAVERAALGEDTVISDSDLAYADQVLDQLQSVGAVNAQVQQNKANIAAEITRATAADNTLQSNINAEASTRAAADQNLQAQISQIVAPSGEAPSAAEVQNARVGADGVTYSTLGEAIRANDSQLKSHIDAIATVNELQTVNVFNKATATNGGYLNGDGNVNAQSDTAYGYTDYIRVNEGDVIRFYRRSQLTMFPGCMYYKDGSVANIKTAPSYVEASVNGEASSFTVPSNVQWIKINLRWGYIDEWMITINNAYPSTYVPYKTETRINDDVIIPGLSPYGKSVLYGKTIMFCGDSITYGAYADLDSNGARKNFGYYIEQQTGCHAQYNAISGSTMTNISGKNPFSVDRYTQLGTGLDYIILAFVTNDSAEDNTVIGQYGDTANTTFWGAWKIVLDYLISTYPNAKIGIIGFWRGNQKYQWTNALRDIAHKYMIPFLDFMFDSQIPLVGGSDFRSYNPDAPFTVDYNTLSARQGVFLHDTVHPNDVGYRYLATIIQDFIESL